MTPNTRVLALCTLSNSPPVLTILVRIMIEGWMGAVLCVHIISGPVRNLKISRPHPVLLKNGDYLMISELIIHLGKNMETLEKIGLEKIDHYF